MNPDKMNEIITQLLENTGFDNLADLNKAIRTRAKQKRHNQNPKQNLQPWQRQKLGKEKAEKARNKNS